MLQRLTDLGCLPMSMLCDLRDNNCNTSTSSHNTKPLCSVRPELAACDKFNHTVKDARAGNGSAAQFFALHRVEFDAALTYLAGSAPLLHKRSCQDNNFLPQWNPHTQPFTYLSLRPTPSLHILLHTLRSCPTLMTNWRPTP